MSRLRSTTALVLLTALASAPVTAQDAGPLCSADQTDDAERPAPNALLPRLGRTFGVAPNTLRGASYVRCANGRLMGCIVGANLECGRANLDRHLAGADAFCRDNPGSDSVPLAATGHDTIYDWRCVGRRAVPGPVLAPVDSLGFMSDNWRPVR